MKQTEAAKLLPDEDLTLSLDALVRSIGIRRASPHAIFLGAGASVSSGIPSAQACIWEWKRSLFLTKNPGVEEQFSEISLASVQQRIQRWLDAQGGYPSQGSGEEYGFYIRTCFPIADDRRAFFQEKVRQAEPHVGYRLLCHLAQSGLLRSVWSTNFDGLAARAAANFKLTPIEIGIDTQGRAVRMPSAGEVMCVSLHGDYRYDALKNTPDELQRQEDELRRALVAEMQRHSLIVCGYSGRDQSIMDALRAACSEAGAGALYWCGYGDGEIPEAVETLIRHARKHGRQAFYVPALGFDDLMTRLALHCLEGDERERAREDIAVFAARKPLAREPFQIKDHRVKTVIKSNAFEIECPAEVLSFELKAWPAERVWKWVKEKTAGNSIVAAPFKGKILAFGTVDAIKGAFGENIKGPVERTPVSPDELRFEDGAVICLMREAVVRSMAETFALQTDGHSELWFADPVKKVRQGSAMYHAHEAIVAFLRRVGGVQYLVLKPSIKVLDAKGDEAPFEIAGPIKLSILGYQHNKPFNIAVNKWRGVLFPEGNATVFEFPRGVGSSFRFRVRRSPVFGQVGLPNGGRGVNVPAKLEPLVRYTGVELSEPSLVFCGKRGDTAAFDTHPVRGLAENRPYDYGLTMKGLAPALRIGIVCPRSEASSLRAYIQKAQQAHRPSEAERDYLVDYPGFQQAYGLPLEIPEPGAPGWANCTEPSGADVRSGSRSVAQQITAAIEALSSAYAPHVVMIFFPKRWDQLRGYRDDDERFDVHDFVKAYAVQRGVATQFLTEDTLSDAQECRVWWWLSLALYAKAMRTPWVLDGLDENTAYVGLGFGIDRNAERGSHVVLGCSHIYSSRGVGLQYRLSKVENPIIRGRNPFMSRDDARRTGETIRQLFFDARSRLPPRVVLHKRTPFLKDERDGLQEGLSGVAAIDMLEIVDDQALRFVASMPKPDGTIDEDNYPVRRGTVLKLDDFSALLWVHGATAAVNPRLKYFQGKRRIPGPLVLRRHAGATPLEQLCTEILGLSKMNWNTFDLYSKLPATLQSSSEIARIGSLLERFGASSYDYRLFI